MQLAARLRREPVVMDTGTRRVTSRGIWSRVDPEGWGGAIYLRLGPLGWIRFKHWAEARWAAQELTKAVKRACPHVDYKPVTKALQTLLDEMNRAVLTGGPDLVLLLRREDVAGWVQRLQQLVDHVRRLEEQVP